jgi:GTPase SAR1 family protein
MNKEISLDTEKIALWGPPNSGKTSLFHALIKRLSVLNLENENFYYEAINPETGFSYSIKEVETRPKANEWKISDEIVHIKRIPKKNNKFGLTDRGYYNFVHSVHLQDYQGSYAVETAFNHNGAVLNSNNLLIAIDGDTKRPSETSYSELLPAILSRFKGSKTKTRIAYCVTKSDRQQERITIDRNQGKFLTQAKDFLETSPDEKMRQIWGIIDQYNQDVGFESEVFLTSAVGMLWKSNSSEIIGPNLANEEWVSNLDQWRPIGVEDPFFWIFNKVEDEYFNRNKELENSRNRLDLLNRNRLTKPDRLPPWGYNNNSL